MFELGVALGTLVILIIGPRLANKLDLFDVPDNENKKHVASVPLVGGVAIFGALILGLLAVDRPEKLDVLMLCLFSLSGIGVIDDKFNIAIRLRIAAQVICSFLMIFAGNVIVADLGVLFGRETQIPDAVGFIFTVLVVLIVVNSVNMSDGIDGNAAGHVMIALFLIGFAQYLYVGEVRRPEWLSALTASIFMFWMVNLSFTPIKKVFMGDAGSIPLGFVIAWLCIDFSQGPGRSLHPVMALWTLVVPIFDVIGVSVVRLMSGRSPFLGDRLHIHHLLPQLLGINDRATLGLLLFLNLILGVVGIFIANLYVEVSLLIYIALLCISVILHIYAGSSVQDRLAHDDR